MATLPEHEGPPRTVVGASQARATLQGLQPEQLWPQAPQPGLDSAEQETRSHQNVVAAEGCWINQPPPPRRPPAPPRWPAHSTGSQMPEMGAESQTHLLCHQALAWWCVPPTASWWCTASFSTRPEAAPLPGHEEQHRGTQLCGSVRKVLRKGLLGQEVLGCGQERRPPAVSTAAPSPRAEAGQGQKGA